MTANNDSSNSYSPETEISEPTHEITKDDSSGCGTDDHKFTYNDDSVLTAAIDVPAERLARALEALGDVAIIHEPSLKVTWANQAAREFFGSIVGKACYEASRGRTEPCENCCVREVFEDGQTRRCEAHAQNNLGNEMHCMVTASPIIGADGKIDAVLKVFTDISERREVEQKLEATKRELELERAALKDKNLVLEGVLEKFEDQKRRIQIQITTNVDKVVMPALRQLHKKLANDDLHYLDLLQSSLQDLTEPFAHHLENEFSRLSAGEIEICNMIKHGMSSKEIASARNVSVQTISVQRKRIRKKLGIAHKNINLYSYLQSK